jgi:ABC-type Na+ efflux pump permease subunit
LGTLEQLQVTPLTRAELIVGKVLPFILIGYVQLTILMVMMRSSSRPTTSCRSSAASSSAAPASAISGTPLRGWACTPWSSWGWRYFGSRRQQSEMTRGFRL